jgi:hypothetical protein
MIGGVLVGGLVAIYFLFFQPPKPSVEPVSRKPVVKETPHTKLPPQPVGKPSVPEEKPITIQLKAAEKTWVSLQVNGQPEQDITLQPGEVISYRAVKRIQLIIGNAGGLDIIFNGRRLERFGKSGEVFAVTFTPEGVEAKRREKTKPPED